MNKPSNESVSLTQNGKKRGRILAFGETTATQQDISDLKEMIDKFTVQIKNLKKRVRELEDLQNYD